MLSTQSFFDLSDFAHRTLFQDEAPVWQPLNGLKDYMDSYSYPQYGSTPAGTMIGSGIPLTDHVILYGDEAFFAGELEIIFGDTTRGQLRIIRDGVELEGASVIMAGAVLIGKNFEIGRGVVIEAGATVKSPAIIGDFTEVRQGAYLRGYCMAGKSCVLGHATEVKNSIFLNDAKAGHFAYLGDSILGNRANLGAGTKFANLKFLPGNVSIRHGGKLIDTGRRKFGAILGDDCQTGCNAVTSPGTVMAPKAILMPNTTSPGGYHKPKAIIR